jgi:hypothetical protein
MFPEQDHRWACPALSLNLIFQDVCIADDCPVLPPETGHQIEAYAESR